MEEISSRKNKAIKYVRSLHSKKNRDLENKFIIEGVRGLKEVLINKIPIEKLYYSKSKLERETLKVLEGLKNYSHEVFGVTDEIMEYMSAAQTSQKILAVLKKKSWDLNSIIKQGNYFVALSEVRDPGNLGTIIRSAQAFKCGGIFLVGDCVDLFNPKTVRSSAGYIMTTPYYKFQNLKEFYYFMKNKGIICYKFSSHSKKIFEGEDIQIKSCYIFGSESFGLLEDIDLFTDSIYAISMEKGVESLNLGVATSIIMHATYKDLFC